MAAVVSGQWFLLAPGGVLLIGAILGALMWPEVSREGKAQHAYGFYATFLTDRETKDRETTRGGRSDSSRRE